MSNERGSGLRKDKGKVRVDLVPAFAYEQFAKVLTKGAQKYAERNWEKGMLWSKILGPMERHLKAIKRGEDFDPETGELHAAHVMCNAAFLTEYYNIYPQGDNRPHRYLNMPKIGLDIDEVLCDWLGAWVKRFNLSVPHSWWFDRKIIDRFQEMREKNELDSFYMNLKPLIKGADLPFEPHCYITSRPVSKEISEQWLDKHEFPARPVYSVGADQTKVQVAEESGIEIFVDDSYRNFVELNNAGICCYLFDAPHNKRYDVGHKRITSLNELVKRL